MTLDLDSPLSEVCIELEKRHPKFTADLFVIKPLEPQNVATYRFFQNFLNATPSRNWADYVDLEGTENSTLRDMRAPYFAGVLGPRTRPTVDSEDEDESSDLVVDLPSRAIQNFQETVKLYRKRPSPSSAATSVGYEKEQAIERTGIYDGRVILQGPARSAPPIELYHPDFGELLHALHSTEPVPDDLLRLTAELMRRLSVVRHAEVDRDRDLQTILNELLEITLARVVNWDRSVADSVNLCDVTAAIQTACRVIVEWKGELGSGGSDPSVQGSFSYAKMCVSPERQKVLDACSCPAFIISIAGSWLSVSGAVFVSHPIVQRLTGYQWLGRSRALDSQQVFEVARIFLALRRPLKRLGTYYQNLAIPTNPRPGCFHPRFFPHITSYINKEGRSVEFAYVVPLQSSVTCVSFEVMLLETKERVVVKYVAHYGEAAHRYMASKHMAPALRFFGPLDAHSRRTYAGLSMVVMDKVDGHTLHNLYDGKPIPSDIEDEVMRAVNELKSGGFVHGDLRAPNVMLLDSPAEGTRVRLIDFDWAGKVGKVRYPFDLTSVITMPSGAKDYEVVTLKHMDSMVEAMLGK